MILHLQELSYSRFCSYLDEKRDTFVGHIDAAQTNCEHIYTL